MPTPPGVVSVVDAVTADLRSRILRGELEPGRALGEVDAAAHYEVARPTARAAIEALVAAGLLSRGPHKSARVTRLSPADVVDVYTTRERLEADVVRQLAAARADLTEASAANAAIRTLPGNDPLAIVDHDMRFHTALIDAVESPRTSRMYRLLADEVRLCMTQTQRADLLTTDSIVAEHERILALIADGDGSGAADLLRAHLDRARDRLAAHLEQRGA